MKAPYNDLYVKLPPAVQMTLQREECALLSLLTAKKAFDFVALRPINYKVTTDEAEEVIREAVRRNNLTLSTSVVIAMVDVFLSRVEELRKTVVLGKVESILT